MSANVNTISNDLEQLVVFSLAEEAYGVDIGKVNGIERMQAITKVPRTSDSVEGVINLRGEVIPVVDIRKVFRLPATEVTKDTRIVVVDINSQQVGCLVDAVTEVLRISSDSVEPPSSMITSSGSDYLLGIVKLEGRMIILLDLDKVIALDGLMMAIEEIDLESMWQASNNLEEKVASEPRASAKPKTGKKSKAKKSKKAVAV